MWKRIKRLYFSLCKRFGPGGGLTLSAYAWRLHIEGNSWWADRLDGAFLFWRGDRDHCRRQFQRETAPTL